MFSNRAARRKAPRRVAERTAVSRSGRGFGRWPGQAILLSLLGAAAAGGVEAPAAADRPSLEPLSEPVQRSASLAEEVARVYAFSLEGEAPRVLFLERLVEVDLVLHNEGSVAWLPDAGFRLGYHWLGFDGEPLQRDAGPRIAIEPSVAPGERLELTGRIRPPQRVGLYRLQWDMVKEGVLWFSERQPAPAAPLVLVLPEGRFLVGLLLPLGGVLLGLLGCAMAWRRPQAGLAAVTVGAADLVWCGASLLGKPFLLYREMSLSFAPGAHWISLSCVALFLLVLLPWGGRLRPWLCWAAAAWGAFYLWADQLYYRFFDDLASVSSLRAAHQTGELSESVRYLAQSSDWLLGLDLLPGLLLAAGLVGVTRKRLAAGRQAARRGRRLVGGVLLVLLAPGILAVVSAVRAREPGQRRTLPPLVAVQRWGLYGFQLRDTAAQLEKRIARPPLQSDELERITDWFRARSALRAGTGPWFGQAAGSDLILIQVESMQQFVVGFELEGQAITPNLDRWAGSALVFPSVRDQTGKGRSSDADYVVFTSILPVADSVAYEYPGNQHVTLAHALAERGYATLSAIPFSPTFWNRQVTHRAYGFETNLFRDDFELGEVVGWGLSDREFLRQMRPRLEALPRPYCVWLSTLALHFPYAEFPDALKELDLGAWEGTSLGNYLHGMHLFDRAFGELMDWLEATGRLEHTVVALWGDHDSGLTRLDELAGVLDVERRGPDRFLADRVPWMLWAPGKGPRGEAAVEAGHTDIAPTTLALLGVDPRDYPFAGRNLLGEAVAGAPEPLVHPKGSWVSTKRVLLTPDNPLGGGCWEREAGRQLAPAECGEEGEAARRQLEVSEQVLAYDLQRVLLEHLSSPPL